MGGSQRLSVTEVAAHAGGSGHMGTAQLPRECGSLEKHRVLNKQAVDREGPPSFQGPRA